MSIYCVYLTIYSGKLLPPFYIGYSTVEKVNNGYHGSVLSLKYKQIWKQELKNNPQLFKTIILSTHSLREDAYKKEVKIQTLLNAHKNPMYINQSIGNHKFVSPKGRKDTPETISKRASSNRGKKQPLDAIEKANKTKIEKYGSYNSTYMKSDEYKRKISVSSKARNSASSCHNKQSWDKISKALKGRKMSPETLAKRKETRLARGLDKN